MCSCRWCRAGGGFEGISVPIFESNLANLQPGRAQAATNSVAKQGSVACVDVGVARQAPAFSLRRQRKVRKRKATRQSGPFASLRVPCGAQTQWGHVQTRLRLRGKLCISSCGTVARGSGWDARRLFAANSGAIGNKSNAADRPRPRDHRPQGLVQRFPRTCPDPLAFALLSPA